MVYRTHYFQLFLSKKNLKGRGCRDRIGSTIAEGGDAETGEMEVGSHCDSFWQEEDGG